MPLAITVNYRSRTAAYDRQKANHHDDGITVLAAQAESKVGRIEQSMVNRSKQLIVHD
jgi:hypothetical protein